MNWIEYRIRQAEGGDDVLDLSTSGTYLKDTLHDVPPRILDLKHLTTIDLSGHKIKALPTWFRQLDNLHKVSLQFIDRFTLEEDSLPPNITHLDLSFGPNTANFDFSSLPHLRKLSLNYCRLERIPRGILELGALEELSLDGNPLPSIPKRITRLPKLRALSIGDEKMRVDPSIITELGQLQTLHLLYCLEPEALAGICELKNLQHLALFNCALKTIPYEWGHLEHLREITLQFYEPGREPKTLHQISNLEALASFDQLKKLYLSTIIADELLRNIAALPGLTSLSITHAHLNYFPATVFRLLKLEQLNLDDSGIHLIPPSINGLRNLKYLSISDAQISQLPEELFELKSLENVWLPRNKLSRIPSNISKLKNGSVAESVGKKGGGKGA